MFCGALSAFALHKSVSEGRPSDFYRYGYLMLRCGMCFTNVISHPVQLPAGEVGGK